MGDKSMVGGKVFSSHWLVFMRLLHGATTGKQSLPYLRIEYLMFSNDPNKNLVFILSKKELPLQNTMKIKFTIVVQLILDFLPRNKF